MGDIRYGKSQRFRYIPKADRSEEAVYGKPPISEAEQELQKRMAIKSILNHIALGQTLDLESSRLVMRNPEGVHLFAEAVEIIRDRSGNQDRIRKSEFTKLFEGVRHAALETIMEGPIGGSLNDQVA